MLALIGNLRYKIIGAVLLGVVAPHTNCAASQLRSGGGRSVLQRAIGLRSSQGNGPVKRGLAGKSGNSSSQPGFSKSSILEKYGAGTNGNWTSMGRTPAAAPAQPVVAGKPFTPPGPSQPLADQPAKAPALGPAVAGAAVVAPAVVATAPVAPAAATTVIGDADLVLEDVKLINAATETAGPVYRMRLRNLGARAAGKFRIGAFAERDGKLSDDAPKVVKEIASLPAGEVSEVTLQLPVSAVRFISTSSKEPVAFDQLLIVVDLDNSVVESDKSNNVANLERTELEAAVK